VEPVTVEELDCVRTWCLWAGATHAYGCFIPALLSAAIPGRGAGFLRGVIQKQYPRWIPGAGHKRVRNIEWESHAIGMVFGRSRGENPGPQDLVYPWNVQRTVEVALDARDSDDPDIPAGPGVALPEPEETILIYCQRIFVGDQSRDIVSPWHSIARMSAFFDRVVQTRKFAGVRCFIPIPFDPHHRLSGLLEIWRRGAIEPVDALMPPREEAMLLFQIAAFYDSPITWPLAASVFDDMDEDCSFLQL
jgi:hypothetical protein